MTKEGPLTMKDKARCSSVGGIIIGPELRAFYDKNCCHSKRLWYTQSHSIQVRNYKILGLDFFFFFSKRKLKKDRRGISWKMKGSFPYDQSVSIKIELSSRDFANYGAVK